MVVDGAIVVAGSFNTPSRRDYNDENLFVLGSPFPTVEGITVDTAACKALAEHMTTEISGSSRAASRAFLTRPARKNSG